jgi:hypothetical protein
MKKLVLYFLFFVAAALILVQCAKFFPSGNKLPALRPPNAGKIKKSDDLMSKNSPAKSTLALSTPFQMAKPGFHLHLKKPSFTLNVVSYISRYQFLSYQYWDVYRSTIKTKQLFRDSLSDLFFIGLWNDHHSGGLMATNSSDLK